MVCTPELFILDDKLVAVFEVVQQAYSLKMECLISINGLEDYTIESNGDIPNKEEFIKSFLLEAKKINVEEILVPHLL